MRDILKRRNVEEKYVVTVEQATSSRLFNNASKMAIKSHKNNSNEAMYVSANIKSLMSVRGTS